MSAAPVPARGWCVEVEHPSGYVWRPDVVGEPTPKPSIDGFPRLAVPVRGSDRWASSEFDGQPLRVWHDGQRQPVDVVETPRVTEEGWVLEGRGATELDENIQLEIDSKESHLVAEDIIQTTSYTANVDTPPTASGTRTSVLTAEDNSGWLDALDIPADDWARVVSGRLELLQSAWLDEAESGSAAVDAFPSPLSVSGASAGEAISMFADSHYVELTFSPGYDIPAGEVIPLIRVQPTDETDTPGFDVSIDGTVVESYSSGQYGLGGWGWIDTAGDGSPAQLSAGSTTTVRIDLTEETNASLQVDLIGVGDARRAYSLPSSISTRASTPRLFAPLPIDTSDVTLAQSVVGGRLVATFDDISGSQAVAISNDQGQSYQSTSNSQTIDSTFSSPGTQIRAQFTLAPYGSRTGATPTSGYLGQTVDSFELFADLESTPLTINQTFDGTKMDVLRKVTPPGYHFQAVRDGSGYAVEWTRSGQRTADEQEGATQFSFERHVEQAVDKVRVRGSVLRKRGEEITADIGAAVALAEDTLVHGRETVYDPATDEEFVAGEDYQLNAQPGEVVPLSGGAIADGQTIAVDYGHRPVGESTTSVTDPKTIVRDIPGLTTDRACELTAVQLADELAAPLQEGTVTLATDTTDWSLLESRPFEAIPGDDVIDIHDAQPSASGTELRVGTRQPIDETINQIRRRVSSVAERS